MISLKPSESFPKISVLMDRRRCHIRGMETYCIVPYRRTYRVEAISANGVHRVLDVWRTEEAAVSQLKTLQISADVLIGAVSPFAQDWRG